MLKSELRTYLYEIYDLERLTGKVACSTLNPRDMIQLKNSLKVFPDINLILKELGLEELQTFENLVTLIDNAIIEDAPISLHEGGIIKKNFNS